MLDARSRRLFPAINTNSRPELRAKQDFASQLGWQGPGGEE